MLVSGIYQSESVIHIHCQQIFSSKLPEDKSLGFCSSPSPIMWASYLTFSNLPDVSYATKGKCDYNTEMAYGRLSHPSTSLEHQEDRVACSRWTFSVDFMAPDEGRAQLVCGHSFRSNIWFFWGQINQSILKGINPEYSLKGLMLKLTFQYFGHLTHWKRPWCWKTLRAGEMGGDRYWDGWMASSTQWTWVWANSRR